MDNHSKKWIFWKENTRKTQVACGWPQQYNTNIFQTRFAADRLLSMYFLYIFAFQSLGRLQIQPNPFTRLFGKYLLPLCVNVQHSNSIRRQSHLMLSSSDASSSSYRLHRSPAVVSAFTGCIFSGKHLNKTPANSQSHCSKARCGGVLLPKCQVVHNVQKAGQWFRVYGPWKGIYLYTVARMMNARTHMLCICFHISVGVIHTCNDFLIEIDCLERVSLENVSSGVLPLSPISRSHDGLILVYGVYVDTVREEHVWHWAMIQQVAQNPLNI